MNAPIRYFGGKGTMSSNILDFFPDKETYDTYIEPFGGSYSIGLKASYVPPVEIYNDLNKNVYALYKTLSDEKLFAEFKAKCDLIYYSQDLRKEFKENLKLDNLNLVDRAFYFFYVNRTSHNGIGGFSANIVVRRNMAKCVSDTLSAIDKLPEIHQRLSKVITMNEDALGLIKRYCDKDNVFFYLDPPYVQSTRGTARYDVEMDDEQHVKFVDICCKSKAKMLISGYDNVIYDKLLENGFSKIQFDVNMTTGTHKPKTAVETLWKNY